MNSPLIRRRYFLSQRKNSGQRLTIGFTGIADFRSFIGQEYIAGIMKAVADYDINLINMAGAVKYSLYDDMEFMRHYLQKFRFMKPPLIDGLVTWASSLCQYMSDSDVIKTFSVLKPLPMVDIGYLSVDGVPSIRIDNGSSIHQLMDHLIRVHGFSKFAFMGSGISRPHAIRLECFRQELKRNGLYEIPDSVYICPSMERKDIAAAADALCANFHLYDKHDLDAVIASSDIIAAYLIEELEKRGISVPDDIAVTGFNNQYAGITAPVPITTVNLEYFQRGYAAVELLIDKIMDPRKEQKLRLVPTSLIIRQSCGCFEQNIEDAGRIPEAVFSDSDGNVVSEFSTESKIRQYLFAEANRIFTRLPVSEKEKFADAVFCDIYETSADSVLLSWFRKILQKEMRSGFYGCRMFFFQEQITRIRAVVIPLVRGDENKLIYVENLLHQLRMIVSVAEDYAAAARRENTYQFNKIAGIAMDFASIVSGKDIRNVLKYQLGELEVSGIMLALSENMMQEFGQVQLDFIHPEPEPHLQELLPLQIPPDSCIPKSFFPKNRQYSMMLEILHHGNQYFGYALMEMGSNNIALYDAVNVLLSHALYVLYLREDRIKGRMLLSGSSSVHGILSMDPAESDSEVHRQYAPIARRIADYLQNHLDEMTDLGKMAASLGISKSHLVRLAKEATGYTIQTLHEKMKMEQAKKLLLIGNMKLSEIAERLGFQNQSYFSAVFKKNTGLSPRKWIQRGSY